MALSEMESDAPIMTGEAQIVPEEVKGEGGRTFDPRPYMMRMQGNKQYLMVPGRVLWARTVMPGISIESELVEWDKETKEAVFRCTLRNPDGRIIAQAYGSETHKDFSSGYIEKAETKAMGRALGLAGFGTQFTGEDLAEGFRTGSATRAIADSPAPLPPSRVGGGRVAGGSAPIPALPPGVPPPPRRA